MGRFQDYTSVKVKQLLVEPRDFTGTNSVSRSPRVGDTGTVVESRDVNGTWNYTVENVDADGLTVWLANFQPEELEPV